VEEGGVALMMEYMDGGSLQDIVDSGGCRDESILASIALQGLMGLACLHSCNQIHRDIKPANILINLNGDVKIADLGILRQMDTVIADSNINPSNAINTTEDENNNNIHRAHTFVGTATYMAPERIDGQDYSYSSDIWSFGLSILSVSQGKLPIEAKNGFWGILHSIRDMTAPTVPDNGEWSDEFRDFIAKCLIHDPLKRSSAIDLLRHPFISKVIPEMDDEYNDMMIIDNQIKTEIETIIEALYSHLTLMYNENIKRHSDMLMKACLGSESGTLSTGDSGNNLNVSHVNNGFQQYTKLLTVDDMARILIFGDESTACSTTYGANFLDEKSGKMSSNNNNNSNNMTSSRTHNRLSNLAYQLHIPLSQLKMIVKNYIIYRKNNPKVLDSRKTTPKAHHS
jgi:serine/threonine protein kinase